MNMPGPIKKIALLFILPLFLSACNKLVEIPAPQGTITTTEAFSDSANASSAVLSLYTNMITNSGALEIGNGIITAVCGSSADEMQPYASSGDEFAANALTADYVQVAGDFWDPSYQYIYQANAIIDGVNSSSGITPSAKKKLIGEAKFFRAFLNFYLVNLFGDIPWINTINYRTSTLAARTRDSIVYDSIIVDLQYAQNALPGDYSAGKGERIRANEYAATALLARTYLYMQQWANAETQATAVINSPLYSLDVDLNSVFLKNSTEAILQWQGNSNIPEANYNATLEGYLFIPLDSNTNPYYIIPDQYIAGFETGDNRLSSWVKSYQYTGDGNTYNIPYKYKVGPAQVAAGANVLEYYMVLRLAEQYLIRAEARARQNKLSDAISDLNVIRNRAGLANTTATSLDDVLAAIAQERRSELFAEWGNRWLDLKRTGQANTVLSPLKPLWQPSQQLYPIPESERLLDPNLSQNTGY